MITRKIIKLVTQLVLWILVVKIIILLCRLVIKYHYMTIQRRTPYNAILERIARRCTCLRVQLVQQIYKCTSLMVLYYCIIPLPYHSAGKRDRVPKPTPLTKISKTTKISNV